jgi:hypothetical protein
LDDGQLKRCAAIPPKIWRPFQYFRHFNVMLRGNHHSRWDSRSSMRCYWQISVRLLARYRFICESCAIVVQWFTGPESIYRAADRQSAIET